jgi:FMN reductase
MAPDSSNESPLIRVAGVSGATSPLSRTRVLVDRALHLFREAGCETSTIAVADLPADALLHREQAPEVQDALERVAEADIVLLASPVYKASFTGSLKCFVDCLPRRGLAGKIVVAAMVGGSPNHMLVIEHAMSPLIASEGGVSTARGIYALEQQIQGQHITDELDGRLSAAVAEAVALVSGLRVLRVGG